LRVETGKMEILSSRFDRVPMLFRLFRRMHASEVTVG
jgi:hypothetical protein